MVNIKCEKCEHEMVKYETATCEGLRCPNCGWNIVTTKMEPIDLDETIYVVSIQEILNPTKNEIKEVSKALNVNYLLASKFLKEGKANFDGKARDIIEKLKEMSDNGIHFSVTPKFPYSF